MEAKTIAKVALGFGALAVVAWFRRAVLFVIVAVAMLCAIAAGLNYADRAAIREQELIKIKAEIDKSVREDAAKEREAIRKEKEKKEQISAVQRIEHEKVVAAQKIKQEEIAAASRSKQEVIKLQQEVASVKAELAVRVALTESPRQQPANVQTEYRTQRGSWPQACRVYPPEYLKSAYRGTITVVQYLVNTEGQIVNASLSRSSGNSELDDVGVRATANCKEMFTKGSIGYQTMHWTWGRG